MKSYVRFNRNRQIGQNLQNKINPSNSVKSTFDQRGVDLCNITNCGLRTTCTHLNFTNSHLLKRKLLHYFETQTHYHSNLLLLSNSNSSNFINSLLLSPHNTSRLTSQTVKFFTINKNFY